MEAPKVEASKAEAPKIEAPKVEAPKIDAVKPEAPRFPGNVMIMSPGDRVGPMPRLRRRRHRPASAGSGRWLPWWRWRRWRVRWVARWQPQALES